MSNDVQARPDDPFPSEFLSNYSKNDRRIVHDFLSNCQPFLSRDLCSRCSRTLSERVKSLVAGALYRLQIQHQLGLKGREKGDLQVDLLYAFSTCNLPYPPKSEDSYPPYGLDSRPAGQRVPCDQHIGDALEIMSNDRYKSVEHRVMANGSKNRVSVPIFVNPKPSVIISPLSEVLESGEKPVYKQVLYSDYVKHFNRKSHDGKDRVEFAKIY